MREGSLELPMSPGSPSVVLFWETAFVQAWLYISSNYRIILGGNVIFNDIQVFVLMVLYNWCILVSRLLERESTAFLMNSSVDRSVTFTHTDSSFLTTQIHHLTSVVLFLPYFWTYRHSKLYGNDDSTLWHLAGSLVVALSSHQCWSRTCQTPVHQTTSNTSRTPWAPSARHRRQSPPQGQACSPSSREHRSSHSYTAHLDPPGIPPPQRNYRYSFKYSHSNSIPSFGMDLTPPLPHKHMKQRQMNVHSFHCTNSFV